jgi:RNA polymerase sigma-70 factor, ECF subfamily
VAVAVMGDVVQLQRLQQTVPLETASDTQLLADLVDGDGNALGELYMRHHLKLYRFLARMAPLDQVHLDDMVQNTFLAASQGASRFQGNARVDTWLMAIAANVLKQHIHKERRRRAICAAFVAFPSERETADSPEALLERQKAMNLLAQQLHKMSHKLKTVFVMCDIEGIAGTEVARVLNLREGTVWRRLHEARKLLRVALAEYREVEK